MKLLLKEMLNLMKISWPEPNLVIVPSSACEPSSMFVYSYLHFMVFSSDDDSEDENPPLPPNLPPYDNIEPELTPTPLLPTWVHSTQEAIGDLVGDPSY
jgi:hypothetical protein